MEAEEKEGWLKEKEAALESEREKVESLRQTLSEQLDGEKKEKARLVQEANEVKSGIAKSEHESIRVL